MPVTLLQKIKNATGETYAVLSYHPLPEPDERQTALITQIHQIVGQYAGTFAG